MTRKCSETFHSCIQVSDLAYKQTIIISTVAQVFLCPRRSLSCLAKLASERFARGLAQIMTARPLAELWLARFAPGLKLPWEGKNASAAVQMMRAWVFLWFIL